MLKIELPSFLTGLELEVLTVLLQDNFEDRLALCQQLEGSSLESREHTGHGFFTNFKIQENATLCARANFELGDVCAIISGQETGFILFVRDGKASFLEGFIYGDDSWPSPEILRKCPGGNNADSLH